jgi:small subunit ribosomal protein S18
MSMTSGGATRRPFFRRRKTCPFSGANAPKIDCELATAIKRSRFLGLLPYVIR